ncbi:MAG: hypothetical protein DRO88_08665 [Promethearchaeia archaeon]|nr:MAG: hypothetical protein DRO88_08665 [Candidatus Lokiarchaeia archaeon]
MKKIPKSTFILKINTALADTPFYVKIDHEEMSIDSIFAEAITELKNVGKPLQSQQLSALYESHQIFNQGKQIEKGHLFSELNRNVQDLNGNPVEIAELDMIMHHSGG